MKAIIITGLSGAGKTQAMDCLEDMGYYCIDNMPPALIKSFIDLTASGKGIDKAAFVIDVRGGKLFEDLKDSLEELRRDGIEFKILYLEASDRTLIRRYNESRRSHPLSEGGTVSEKTRKPLCSTLCHSDIKRGSLLRRTWCLICVLSPIRIM